MSFLLMPDEQSRKTKEDGDDYTENFDKDDGDPLLYKTLFILW